jgi:hypothetical protein
LKKYTTGTGRYANYAKCLYSETKNSQLQVQELWNKKIDAQLASLCKSNLLSLANVRPGSRRFNKNEDT